MDNSTTTPSLKDSSSCYPSLTLSESDMVSSWRIYTNSADGYSFKHPADWGVIEQRDTSVILTNNAALFSFQFGLLDEDQLTGQLEKSR